MNFHQTPEEIINNATAEQRILWNSIFLSFGEKIGMSQLNYKGAVAATEFLNYSINKLYFCIRLRVGYDTATAGAQAGLLRLYNNANTIDLIMQNNNPVWDATAAAIKYNIVSFDITNCLFSKIVLIGYQSIQFIGYRLSI